MEKFGGKAFFAATPNRNEQQPPLAGCRGGRSGTRREMPTAAGSISDGSASSMLKDLWQNVLHLLEGK